MKLMLKKVYKICFIIAIAIITIVFIKANIFNPIFIGISISTIIILLFSLYVQNAQEWDYIEQEQNYKQKWDYIEEWNAGLGIFRTNTYIDIRGYLRWKTNNRLCHREIAYKYSYKKGYAKGIYPLRFSKYDIHHINQNKLNNQPNNLKILTRKEHQKEHKKRY